MNVNNANGVIKVRRSNERGHANHGWLDSYHTFSFGEYFDRNHMAFRSLRVINEDWVEGGEGFGRHPHQDMEIFTYIVEGGLKHEDSMGHQSTIKAGDVQKITAGTGIYHSEFNASAKDQVHLLQIWIMPERKGLKPSYQEFTLAPQGAEPLTLIGSPQGGNNIVQFNQDVYIYRGILPKGKDIGIDIKPERGVWLQVVKGKVELNGHLLSNGDAISIENSNKVFIQSKDDAEFLVFDLA